MKIRFIWKCGHCGDVVISYSHLKRDMNYCDCGKSAVDLEDGSERDIGKVIPVSRKMLEGGRWIRLDKPIVEEQVTTCLSGWVIEINRDKVDFKDIGNADAIEAIKDDRFWVSADEEGWATLDNAKIYTSEQNAIDSVVELFEEVVVLKQKH